MSTITLDHDIARRWLIARMREVIGENGRTIRSAALAMGMAPVTLSRRLNGRIGKSFTIPELRAMAGHLGIDWMTFFPDEMLTHDIPKIVDFQDAR